MATPRDTIHHTPNAPSFSHYPAAEDQVKTLGGGSLADYGAYPFLYGQQAQGPPPTMTCGGNGGPLYNQNNGWYCPLDERRHCPLETKPHDRARCDQFTGQWVVNTVDGQVKPFARTQIQMQPGGVDGQWPPLVGTLGPKVFDPRTGMYYYQGSNALPFNAGYDPTAPISEETYRKSLDNRKPGRGGLVTTRPFSYKMAHADNGISMDRAYTGVRIHTRTHAFASYSPQHDTTVHWKGRPVRHCAGPLVAIADWCHPTSPPRTRHTTKKQQRPTVAALSGVCICVRTIYVYF